MVNVKLVMVGDVGVGKTSMLIVYTSKVFPEEYIPTVFDCYAANYTVDDTIVSLGLWDTASGHEYDRLRPLSYPQTDVLVLNFSCVHPESFDRIRTKWIPEITQYIPNVPFLLVATKTDLREEKNTKEHVTQRFGRGPISKQEGEEMAREVGAQAYFETSAKRGDGVDEVFESAMRSALHAGTRRVHSTQKSSKCSLL